MRNHSFSEAFVDSHVPRMETRRNPTSHNVIILQKAVPRSSATHHFNAVLIVSTPLLSLYATVHESLSGAHSH